MLIINIIIIIIDSIII